jgi:hypothetical protein
MFAAAVTGLDEDGDSLPFSLKVIDPMPGEYDDPASYRDSAEYRELGARYGELETGDARLSFIHANPGFAAERMAEIEGFDGGAAWYNWRLQHWGTKWDVSGETFIEFELRDDGREVSYRFETALGGVEPAVAGLATRYPLLAFDLTTTDEFDETIRTRWQAGEIFTG